MIAPELVDAWLSRWPITLTTAQRVGLEERIARELERRDAVVEAALQVDARVGPHTTRHEQVLRDALSDLDAKDPR